jgi:beta-glucanase (GH16 family)
LAAPVAADPGGGRARLSQSSLPGKGHKKGSHHRHKKPHSKDRTPAPETTSDPGVAPARSLGPDPAGSTSKSDPGATRPGPDSPIWADEFDGPAGAGPDSTKWNFDVGGHGWGGTELQYYTSRPSNASLDGQGDLVIAARAEEYTGHDGVKRNYTSARLQTLRKFQFTYGLMEARIQVPAGKGLLPAFWSLGNDAYDEDDSWPACGEIDAMEVLGSESNVLDGTLHGPWPSAPHGIGGEVEAPESLSAGFHTYGVRWEPDRIGFLLDGIEYEAVSREDLPAGYAWPFQHPNFLLLNLAVGGEWPGAPDASTQFPARMVVDWVRVWQ